VNRWEIGNVKITRIVELEITGGTRFILPDATRDAVKDMKWMAPHFMDDEGNLVMSVHALVVETPDRKIMVDTCIGNDKERSIPGWNKLQLPFLADLKKAGYGRDDIDTVLCTHLHVDHVGWNTMLVDGKWVPTFPNARYLIGRQEYEHWAKEGDDEQQAILGDSVQPIFDGGLATLVEMNHRISDEIRLLPTPGHTPGHVSVLIESGGERAMITGDMLHHPCQFANPHWSPSFDSDPVAGAHMRRVVMEEVADAPILVIGTHFAAPTAGHVRRDGTAFRFDT
jgi:glyoxylase-like metal-dependent hydrolase (beta-lactamase superfamily II)